MKKTNGKSTSIQNNQRMRKLERMTTENNDSFISMKTRNNFIEERTESLQISGGLCKKYNLIDDKKNNLSLVQVLLHLTK